MRNSFLLRLLRDQQGLAAVEYGFLCGLIVIAMVTALSSFAGEIKATWANVSTQSASAVSQAAA